MDLKLAIFRPMLKLAMERNGHGAALGFELTKIGRGEVEMTFPYKEEVVGNPITGVVHGGVIVSLLDTACGTAAITTLTRASVTPTMDLRATQTVLKMIGEKFAKAVAIRRRVAIVCHTDSIHRAATEQARGNSG